MYYPPLFASPAGVRACFDAPPATSNPLDLSTKAVRPDSSSSASHQADAHQAAAEELMLDHRKLAASLAAQSLLSRQLLDPASLFRLGYAPEGLALPPFCYDGASRAAAVPTSLASHQLMTSLLQQQQQLREQQHQQALLAAAARNSAAAQQAAVAAAFMDPSLHLRNGMSQREAAAALAATRGLYAPALPTPMVLPAFSLYTEDKGAFTSLRTSDKGQQSFLNGLNGGAALEAARFAEHLQRLREQHLQQHSSGKCGSACCGGGLTATSMPCACCVQSPPSQSALCARSPMGTPSSGGKDPTTSAATAKACDFMQTGGLSFLHRSPAATTSSSSADLRLSVSSLCTTVANSDATTTSSGMRDKHHQSSMYQSAGIWNAGLPTVSSSGKTAFSVPKKKDVVKDSSVYSKDMKPSASMKDILKDSSAAYDSRKYDPSTTKPNVPIKSETLKKEDRDVKYSREDYSSKYYKNIPSAHDVKPFIFSRHTSPKSNGHMYNGNDALTTVTSVTPVVPTKCEGGTIPIARMPPLLEAVRPADHLSFRDHFQETAIASPQGPPPLVAATNGDPAPYSSHKSPRTSYAATAPTSSSSSAMYLNPSFRHHGDKQQQQKASVQQEAAKPLKTAKKAHSGSSQPTPSHKFSNGLPPPASFIKEEPSLALPKPIPHLPSHPYASHYRSAQHQLSLQTHNGWIPPAHPNVTVATPASSTSAASVTSSPTVTTTGHVKSEAPSPFFTSPGGIKREPDYPDSTPNVLQSLLIRSGHGLDPLAAPATSVITPLSGPLFGLDYRYPFGHHPLGLPKQDLYGLTGSGLPLTKDSKQEGSLTAAVIKTETVSPSATSSKSAKKRSNGLVSGAATDEMAAKKRFLSADYTVPRYSFQPPGFANEAAEAPECPYTFIAEPPLNYTSQPKFEAKERSVKAEMPEKSQCHRDSAEETETKSGEILAKPLKKPHPRSANRHQSFRMTDRARARSKLRKRLLARIYQERRPLALICGVQDHRVTIEKEMALQHTRKLLSQISLRWSHRRYLYRWYASRRKAMEGSRLKKRVKKREGAKAKRDMKGERMQEACHVEDSVSKASDIVNAIPMPSEMRRLMVNKALGETILHRAARLGYPEVVAYCLETACGNVNARDNAGYTPLHECCSRGHLDIARALLRYGADVNASAAGGIRPLHDAVENDHVEVVRLLLSYGADPSIATYSGLEPIKLARSPLMAKFLQGFLADISGEVDNRPHLDVGGESPHLPWRFWGSSSCLDPSELGYDVFEGVPSDAEGEGEGDNDFLFEVSDSPHLPTFRLLVANSSTQCNYLRLSDVLRKLSIGREEFASSHGHIEIVPLPRHEFESGATCSQLLTGTKLDSLFTPAAAAAPRPSPCAGPDRYSPDRSDADTTELVRLDNAIRRVLGIETISVR